MISHRVTLEKVMAQVTSNCGVNIRIIRKTRHYDEVMMDIDALDDPREIAAIVIDEMCNHPAPDWVDQSILLTAVVFLEETLGVPTDDPNRDNRLCALKDLYPSTREQYVTWAKSWFD